MSDSRGAALEVLRGVRAGKPFNLSLDRSTGDLSTTDRRLTVEIVSGVLRNLLQLDRQLAPLIHQGWDGLQADVRDILRIGTYQIQFLSRVPRYAAVNTAVEMAKQSGNSQASGLVNAVLKQIPDELPPLVPTGDIALDLAQRFSHPLWLVSRWIDHFGIADTEKLLDHNNRPPQIVLQPIGLTRDELSEKLNGAGYPHDVDPEAPGLALARGVPIGRLPGYDDGHFIVQDRAQARLIEWADVATRSSVWDCCAAPGGKTCLLADGRWVVASDRSRDRLSTLARTLARTRRAADAFAGDATTPPLRDETFDAVLLDAPCSATGTMRRHPDARWRITPKRIASAARLQARLLQSVAGVVKVGGVLIYATCSLEQEENQLQVDAALARDPRFERTKEDLSIFPWHSGTDGVYAARLERVK